MAGGKGVWKAFGATTVFRDASFCFRRGMNILWAPNGSGKSTLIKILLGIVKPDRGVVWIDRSLGLGVALEEHPFPPSATPAEILNYAELIKGTGAPRGGNRAQKLLGVGEVLGKRVSELSAGTVKKVLLAQALRGRPRLLVLDEPLANLDPASRLLLAAELNRLRDEGVSMIIATHILSALQPDYVYTITDFKVLGPYKLSKERLITVIDPETGEERKVGLAEAVEAYRRGYIVLDT